METFFKICVLLLIVGGINWGLVGLFQLDLVSLYLWARQACAPSRTCFQAMKAAVRQPSKTLCSQSKNKYHQKRPDVSKTERRAFFDVPRALRAAHPRAAGSIV